MHLLPVPHFEDMLLASGRSVPELERELRLLLAVKLFPRAGLEPQTSGPLHGLRSCRLTRR
jgi:hypothetical protein